MKKIGLIVTVICLVFVAGSAFGDEYTTTGKTWAGDPDSMINLLDPSNAPAPIVPHTGLMGLTEEGLPGAGGSAAGGGPREIRDSMVNYLDPSFAPSTDRFPKKTTTEVLRFDPESGIHHQISPVE